jgi:hypothetical protein
MKQKLLLTFLAMIALIGFTTHATAQYEVKDSFYFMKGDGEFSDAEKDEEAQYIFNNCTNNVIQSLYFDCACIAGAFRQERDNEKLVPQAQIINSLFTDKKGQCANTANIAGEAYQSCQEYASIFRAQYKNNNNYCKCVANKTALEFTKRPKLDTNHINRIRSNAMVSCS